MALEVKRLMIMMYKINGKFQPKSKWSFVVEMVYSIGAYHLINQDSDMMMISINGKFIKNICIISSSDKTVSL